MVWTKKNNNNNDKTGLFRFSAACSQMIPKFHISTILNFVQQTNWHIVMELSLSIYILYMHALFKLK